jgi:hypothetical protein
VQNLNWQGTGWIDSDLQGDYSDGEYLVVGEKHVLSWDMGYSPSQTAILFGHYDFETGIYIFEDELWLRQSIELGEDPAPGEAEPLNH